MSQRKVEKDFGCLSYATATYDNVIASEKEDSLSIWIDVKLIEHEEEKCQPWP